MRPAQVRDRRQACHPGRPPGYRAGSSFSIASKKIARSPNALQSTAVVAGDVTCGASRPHDAPGGAPPTNAKLAAESRHFPSESLRVLHRRLRGLGATRPGRRPTGDRPFAGRHPELSPPRRASAPRSSGAAPAARFGIGRGQPVEGLVQGQQVLAEFGGGHLVDVKVRARPVAAALAATLAAGVLDQDPASPRPRRRRSGPGCPRRGCPPPTSRRYASWTRAVG